MRRDFSDPEDHYGIGQYTAQSADLDVEGNVWRKKGGDRDERGCSLIRPRNLPTQKEADEAKGD